MGVTYKITTPSALADEVRVKLANVVPLNIQMMTVGAIQQTAAPANIQGALALMGVAGTVAMQPVLPKPKAAGGCTTDICALRVVVHLQVSDPRVTTPFPNVQTLIATLKPQTAVTGALAAALRGAVFGTTPGYNVTFHDMLPVGKLYV